MERRSILSIATPGTLTRGKARKAAQAAKYNARHGGADDSALGVTKTKRGRVWERFLGHFGSTVAGENAREASKKGAATKKKHSKVKSTGKKAAGSKHARYT